MNDPQQFIFNLLLRAPGILLGLTIHEFAHGYVAWLKGDSTAKDQGRLSFNPINHLDPLGTLMLCFGWFGWAKPVPVNPNNLDNPKRDMISVSAAGPVSNIILALFIGYIFRFFILQNITPGNAPLWSIIIAYGIIINIGLAFFNLIPIPPLDGSNILIGILPSDKIMPYLRAVQHVPKIFLILIILEQGFHIPIFSKILYPLWKPFFNFWQHIIFGGDSWQLIIFGGKAL